MNERSYVSPTQIGMIDHCEQKYFFRYVLGQKIPPGVAMIRGSGTHVAAEANYKQKIESGVDLPVKDLCEIADAGIEEKLAKEGLELTAEERSVGVENIIAQIKDKTAYTFIPLYANDVAPLVQPEMVEEKIIVELPEHTHDIMCIIDVADVDTTLRDLKTTTKRKSQSEIDNSIQLSIEALAYRWKKGVYPKDVVLDVLVDRKPSNRKESGPFTQTLHSTRDDSDTEAILSRVNVAIDRINRIRSGEIEPKPAALGHFLCSPRWCGFWFQCPHVSSSRMAAAEANDDES